ncbi:IS21-like element helper ATPase IstB [bacterium]|nr:IS21-like element helper ATPase IstB [bacterium]MCI0613028.1 IS21-like element helper ATPase IstB [bacterium]
MSNTIKPQLIASLKQLHLPAFNANFSQHAALAANEGWPYDRYLLGLCELELSQRQNRKVQKLLTHSKLPRDKTLSTFDRSRLSTSINRKIDMLLEGDFVDRRENILIFGNPGSGKTHLLAAIGQELIAKGKSVYFGTCSLLVQRLLRAKAELWLEKELKRLDRFEALIIDDLGYVQQSREEMEVLFTLLAHRYEHRTVMLTSNLVFSEWEKIFKDPMTTAAAIDRLVHHSIIIELNLTSYRVAAAQKSKNKEVSTPRN